MAVSTIKAGSAGVDQSFTIATTAWSSTAPYTYTWSSDKITAGSRVTVDFYGTPAESSDVSYIEYEKVSVSNGYGIQFTSPVKPTVSISLVAHILNSKPLRLENITGADVSTSVISGAANVNEALSALNSNMTTWTDITSSCTWHSNSYNRGAYYHPMLKLLYIHMAISNANNQATIVTLPSGYSFGSTEQCIFERWNGSMGIQIIGKVNIIKSSHGQNADSGGYQFAVLVKLA